MHMDTYPQLVTLVILFPAIGAFINLFVGARLTEKSRPQVCAVRLRSDLARLCSKNARLLAREALRCRTCVTSHWLV